MPRRIFIERSVRRALTISMPRLASPLLVSILLLGCVTAGDINDAIARVDRVWQLEYQQTEDELRYRAVDATYDAVLLAVRRTFVDLGMPVQGESIAQGLVIAEMTAPTPLTLEEWKEVASVENPRLKQIGSPFLVLEDDPQNYVVTVKASVRPLKGKTLVLLDYTLDSPKMRRQGLQPSKHAPAKAVQLASLKFWVQLEKRLREVKAPAPRRRTKQEMDA